MKINKILAAGVAATLAVTSLSAVASAEEKKLEWKMDYTFSKVQWNNTKIQWLGDNDYIGGAGYGAAATAKTLALTELTAATGPDLAKLLTVTVTAGAEASVTKTYAAAGDTHLKILEGAGGKPLAVAQNAGGTLVAGTDAIGIIGAAETVPATLATYKTNITTAMTNANAAAKAAAVGCNTVDESAYSADKTLGDLKALANYLQIVSDNLAKSDAAVRALGTTTGIAAAEALKAEKTIVDSAITELKKSIRNVEDALIGAPLLTDTEVGGIQISTEAVPLVAGTAGKGAKYVQVTGAKLTIKGTKRGSTANESWSGDFQQAYNSFTNHVGNDDDKATALYLAFAPKYVNRPAFVNLGVFGTITDAEIDISYKLLINEGTAADKDLYEAAYYTEKEYDDAKKVALSTLRADTAIKVYDNLKAGDTETFDLEADDAGWVDSYTKLADDTTNLYKLYKALQNSVITGDVTENSNSKETRFPFLTMTTDNEGETIVRNRAWPLSVTGAHVSYTTENAVIDQDGSTQTYDDFGMGTQPRWFAGLASQVADFFTKQNNGQIIFYLQDPALADKWVSYGVPSTEVGLRTLQGTAMALFFNYHHTTGSIQSIGVVDKDAWTITFDIANVLDDFGGLTKGNLSDIYYGLNTGLQYGKPYNNKGYVVNKVVLKYDDAPAAVDATTDDDAAVVVADDDDDVVADDDDDIFADDDVVADDDDDDDAGIIEDDDDDDTDVNNDVDYVDGADDDANPGTGVGLAVIPAIVAAAAAIVSKKRK